MLFKKILRSLFFTLYIISHAQLPVHIKPTQTRNYQLLEQELPLIILICSYNNAPWIEKNLDSVLMQKYTNWRIVYFDDASTDSTPQLVTEYLKKHNLEDRCTLLTNQTRCRKLKNLYTAFHHHIDDHEIIVQLDGDDWLAHEHVFTLINNVYQKYDVWMTYGNYQNVPENLQVGFDMAFIPTLADNGTFRLKHMYMHLRTFYGWLAKNIQLADLLCTHLPDFKSRFYPASNDAATMWPMFEMAGRHFAFIEEVLYCLNRTNPINGFKVDQKLQRKAIRELHKKVPVYQPLEKPIYNRLATYQSAQAHCLILSENNPDLLERIFYELNTYVQGIDEIWLLYKADSKETEAAYQHQILNTIHTVRSLSITDTSVKTNILKWLNECSHDHILICTDAICIKKPIKIPLCILELERTGAYAFYLNRGHDDNKIPDQHIWDDLYASKFHASTYAWFNELDMTLMRTANMKDHIMHMPDTISIQKFIDSWAQDLSINLDSVGLYYKEPKAEGVLVKIHTQLPPLPKLSRRAKVTLAYTQKNINKSKRVYKKSQ